VVAELLETLGHFEQQSGRRTSVLAELETVLQRLDNEWQNLAVEPPGAG
jgi:uncharacterized protein YukE